MAALMRKLVAIQKINKLVINKNPALVCNAVRFCYPWNYLHKPGPYPKTPEERAASAKKYGLTIEEYEPMPEEEGYGDYPKLPDISMEAKDVNYPYDFPEHKRNFGEPLHHINELIGEDRVNLNFDPLIPKWQMCCFLFGTLGGFWLLYEFLEDKKMEMPVSAKQYPRLGQVHYTFDPTK